MLLAASLCDVNTNGPSGKRDMYDVPRQSCIYSTSIDLLCVRRQSAHACVSLPFWILHCTQPSLRRLEEELSELLGRRYGSWRRLVRRSQIAQHHPNAHQAG